MLLGAPSPAVAAAASAVESGQRVSVGLFGDSVTEGIVIPGFERVGLAAQLARAETGQGFSAGGQGLIAANQYQWHFNAYGILGLSRTPATGWALVGAQDGAVVQPGTDGPSGYSAVTVSPTATATTTVRDSEVEVLYTTSVLPCSFTVTSGADSWTISTGAAARSQPAAAESPISLGAGTHRLVVHGARCGVVFDGIVAQDPVAPGTTQIQVDNDGHSARLPSTDLARRVEQAILEQHYKVSVFLYGYIGELLVRRGTSAATYERALLTRARLARRNGGTCLIAAPTPMLGVARAAVRLIAGLERAVARRAGCSYTGVLTRLWNPATSAVRGLTVLDGIHPTAQGYALMARALAPLVARLART